MAQVTVVIPQRVLSPLADMAENFIENAYDWDDDERLERAEEYGYETWQELKTDLQAAIQLLRQ